MSNKSSHCPKTGEVRRQIFTEATRRRPVVPLGVAKVKSEFQDQCDINRIVARIKKTKDMSPLNLDRSWTESDFTQMPSNYTDALLLTISVRDKFMSLPATKRTEYHNDPANWIADLQKSQKALREAALASVKASDEEATKEADYRQKRRDALLKPSNEGDKK